MANPLHVLRAEQWLHFVVLPLGGLDLSQWLDPAFLRRALLGAGAAAGSLGYAYGINAVFDRTSDVSREKNPLAGEQQIPVLPYVVVGGSAALALACAVALGKRATARVGLSLVAATLYSVPPRLKDYPVVGLAANTLIFVPLLGVSANGKPVASAMQATLAGLIVQNQLLHEIADSVEDERGGSKTTVGFLGVEKARAAAVLSALPFGMWAHARSRSKRESVAAFGALAAGSIVAVANRAPHRVRRLHRYASMLGGGLLQIANWSSR